MIPTSCTNFMTDVEWNGHEPIIDWVHINESNLQILFIITINLKNIVANVSWVYEEIVKIYFCEKKVEEFRF